MEKRKKIKVLILSKVFPGYHPRAGELTGFREKFGRLNFEPGLNWKNFRNAAKVHTIRAVSDWPVVAERINKGEMLLSVRQWIGKPYRTKQDPPIGEFNQVGLQYIRIFKRNSDYNCWVRDNDLDNSRWVRIDVLARNDGLSTADFKTWFEPYLTSDGCIDKDSLMFNGVVIHFTKFKY